MTFTSMQIIFTAPFHNMCHLSMYMNRPPAEPDSQRAAICLNQLEVERTWHIHTERVEMKENKVGKGASWEVPQQSRPIAA